MQFLRWHHNIALKPFDVTEGVKRATDNEYEIMQCVNWHERFPTRAVRHDFQYTRRQPATSQFHKNFHTGRPFAAPTSVIAVSKAADVDRLPTSVKPTHYDLTIRTDLEKLTFQGLVKISLDVKEETFVLVLNSTGLELGAAALRYGQEEQLGLIPTQQADLERISFTLQKSLPAGSKAQLQIAYSGKITDQMKGYYRSSWMDGSTSRNYALTQFEAISARHALPCYDEPLLKATFTITMISRADTVNLSNMPAASDTPYVPSSSGKLGDSSVEFLSSLFLEDKESNEKWKVTKFETTPLMSTYLVAFANGHFAHLETTYHSSLSGKNISLRFYATPDHISQGQFVLDITLKALPIYEKIFDVEYPLPKLDTLVAQNFDSGAMENWGLVIGGTRAMFVDPDKADVATKRLVASTQCHEVAHMWLGNLTTMEWWTYVYLKEGFATLIGENVVLDKLFPEWKCDSGFINEHLAKALSLDSKLSSHPIEVECPKASDIDQIFDGLSYSKAACVLRMLSNYIGEERFLKGVSLYLKKNLYGNTTTSDLWAGIEAATDIDVGKLMDKWITAIGYPVLTITEQKDGILVRQDRFLETGLPEDKDNDTIWTVPLNILSIDENDKLVVNKAAVLNERQQFFPVDTSKLFKINAGTTGVYRVKYSPQRLVQLANEASRENSGLSLNDRVGLMHDAMALSQSGHSNVNSALTYMHKLREEKEYLVWESVAQSLNTLVSVWWENGRACDLLKSLGRHLYEPLVKRLGYTFSPRDSAETNLLRALAIGEALYVEEKTVIDDLTGRFARFIKTGDESVIPQDIVSSCYLAAVKYGGRAEFEVMKQIYEKPKTTAAQVAAIYALGASQDAELVQETLQYILHKARDQDLLRFCAGLRSNVKARRVLATFFKVHYDTFVHRRQAGSGMSNLVKIAFGALTTKDDYHDIVTFFEGKDVSGFDKALSQTLEGINAKAAWIDRSTPDLVQWLESHFGSETSNRL